MVRGIFNIFNEAQVKKKSDGLYFLQDIRKIYCFSFRVTPAFIYIRLHSRVQVDFYIYLDMPLAIKIIVFLSSRYLARVMWKNYWRVLVEVFYIYQSSWFQLSEQTSSTLILDINYFKTARDRWITLYCFLIDQIMI